MGFFTKSKKEDSSLLDNAKEILKSAERYGLTERVQKLSYSIEDEQEWIIAVGHMVNAYQDGYIKGAEEK